MNGEAFIAALQLREIKKVNFDERRGLIFLTVINPDSSEQKYTIGTYQDEPYIYDGHL